MKDKIKIRVTLPRGTSFRTRLRFARATAGLRQAIERDGYDVVIQRLADLAVKNDCTFRVTGK